LYELIAYIKNELELSETGLPASQLCAEIRKNESWDLEIDEHGGFKKFCLFHDDKFRWDPAGSGKVWLVKTGSIPVGAKVSIKTAMPCRGWGLVHSWSVGTVRSFSGSTYVVDFPEVEKWGGEEEELAIVSGGDRSAQDFGTKDPAFDQFGFACNKDGGKFEFTGNGVQENRGRHLWEFGFLHGAQKLTPLQPYFEVKIIVNRANGVGIGLAGSSFNAGSMVGWDCDSIGFHSDDGVLYYEGNGITFGPTSSTGDTIGCGIFFDATNTPQTVFFTRNQRVVGRFPLRSKDCDMLFPVVTSALPAVVQVNLTAMSPAFPMACTLQTFEFEAQYNDDSTRFKPVTIKGPPNSKGETPVNFKGYKDTAWVPPSHLKRTDTPLSKEFSNLELAFGSAVDGDTIEVRDCGIHLTRDPIDIKTAIMVLGTGATKPTISCSKAGGAVLSIFADTLLQNLCVKSVGGDQSKRCDEGGSVGALFLKGKLTIDTCDISSTSGSGVVVVSTYNQDTLMGCKALSIINCRIGPCGRHGIILDRCAENIIITKVEIASVANIGLANNGGNATLTDCVINDCLQGVLFSGIHRELAEMTMLDSRITNCKGTALALVSINQIINATLTGCTIEKCKVALEVDGARSKIFVHNTNSVKDCTDANIIKDNGQINSGEANMQQDITLLEQRVLAEGAAALSLKELKEIFTSHNIDYSDCFEKSDLVHKMTALDLIPTIPQSAAPSSSSNTKDDLAGKDMNSASIPSAQTSNESSKLSVETANFARYCRLLMDVGREVMVTIFRACYQKEAGKPWSESHGASFLNDKFPDGHSQRQLGKHCVDPIRAGKCEEWDVSLLSSLLLCVPGYIKCIPRAKDAVETLREQRNKLAHSADLLAKLSLSEKQFKEKWEIASAALDVLMDQLLPAEKRASELRIEKIANEQVRESDLEPLFQRVNEDIKHIQDKVDEAMKKAEKAATMSQVQKAMDAKLESVLNQNGQVDQNLLPRDITLSNQKRYRLIKQVGKGGMGTVFEGKLIDATSDGGKVALKICHADASLGRAEREAEILQRLGTLNHDNIVKFLDNALDGSHLVIVMELIKGQPLDDWLEVRYTDGNRGVMFSETQPIIKQLVAGMSVIHSQDIAHRDLKPGNLIFDEVTGKLVIVDFGLSKQHNTNSTITGANDQLGTLLYMSPEQLDGDAKATSYPSDVWSIGIVWHEILTSFTPFEPSATASELGGSGSRSKRRTLSKREEGNMVYAICNHVKPRKLPMLDKVPDVPAAVNSMIAKCLSTNKKERYQDAQKLLLDLIEVFEELEREKAEESQKSPSKDVPRPKPFKEYSVGEVFQLVYDISEGFHEIAHEMKVNGINGQYFLDMLAVDDEDMTTSIANGGLGFRKLQLKSVKAAIKKLDEGAV